MADDPFPRERVTATLRRLPAYLRLAWRLARDPLLSRARRAAVVAAAGYLASPIDLVPGIIPVAGQLDDLAVALGAIRFALAGLDPERRQEHLAAVGLEDGHLAEDLRTVGATSAWLVRAGARTTATVARGSGRLAVKGVKAAGAAARLATPAAKQAASAGLGAASAGLDVASAGIGAAKDLASRRPSLPGRPRRPSLDIRVARPHLPALGPGRTRPEPGDDPETRLDLDPDDA